MVVTISSNSSEEEIRKALDKLAGKKNAGKSTARKFDAHKYCGVIKLKEDPLTIQKEMRNEWE